MSKCTKLQELLLKGDYVSPSQISICLQEQSHSSASLSALLIKFKFIEDSVLQKILSQISGYPFIDLNNINIDVSCLTLIPFDFCEKNMILPFNREGNNISLAMCDPENILLLDQVHKLLNDKTLIVKPYHAEQAKILKLLQPANPVLAHVSEADREVILLLENALKQAVRLQASDMHFQPEEQIINLRYRIDGFLKLHQVFHKNLLSSISVRLKILSNLDISESRHPQNGRFTVNIDGRDIDFRLSTHPTMDGENFVIRILDHHSSLLRLEQLGFIPEDVNFLKRLVTNPQGMILNCGPTGSGKTTTMYAIFQEMDVEKRNIMTLEQPIEYRITGVRQTEIKEDSHLNFAYGIRSILRQDPDVIFVSEIRDEETAKMALRASITGHLVLSTIHSQDCVGVLSRLLDLGVEPFWLSGHLLCIMSQRLVRRLCIKCEGQGCNKCYDGYRGRIAITEFLNINQKINQILSAMPSNWQSLLYGEVQNNIWQKGMILVNNKVTTLDELERCLGNQPTSYYMET